MAALISIILKTFIAMRCYSIAKEKGRNAKLASVLGFFFGLFALIGYSIAGNKAAPVVIDIK